MAALACAHSKQCSACAALASAGAVGAVLWATNAGAIQRTPRVEHIAAHGLNPEATCSCLAIVGNSASPHIANTAMRKISCKWCLKNATAGA
jgi:hypothetical protein